MARKKRASYTRWLKGFLAIFLGLLILVALFNVLIDGVGIFHLSKGLKYAAQNLLEGKMVAGHFQRSGEWELQRLVVEQYPKQRDAIILGSSRTMAFRKRFINGNPDFFNHSLGGGGMEDFIAVIDLYRGKGVFPKTVILGIDPWMFNRNNGLKSPWRALESGQKEMLAEIKNAGPGREAAGKSEAGDAAKTDRFSRFTQLINLDYTVQNWELLRSGKKLRVTDTVNVNDFVREPDGSLHFPFHQRYAKMTKDGPASAMPDVYFNDFDSLSNTGLLEGLVVYLQKRGVRVVFFLPALHPFAYRSCLTNPRYEITLKVETYIRDLAAKYGVTVVGSFDPALYGFKGEDFFDGHHGHEIVLKKPFEEYK